MKNLFLLPLLLLQIPLWAQRPELVVPTGHTSVIISVAFSPDGQYVLTGSLDHTAKLWSLDGREIKTFQGHTAMVNGVAFSPDGQTILTGSSDGTAKLWSIRGGEARQTFQGHKNQVFDVAFSPDGQTILTGGWDGTAKLWSVRGGAALQTFQGHAYAISSVAFSPDGKTILTGSYDATAKLWSIRGGEARQTFQGHTLGIASVAFSPDGQTILTGSSDGTAKLWSGRGGAARQTFQGHTAVVNSVAFSPDGQTILTGSWDDTAKLWSVRGGAARQTFQGHTAMVYGVAFSPDGQTVLTGSRDNTAKLWSVRGGVALQTFEGFTDQVNGVAFSPDGQTILSNGWDGTAILWSVRGGAARQTFQGHTAMVNGVAFSPDGQTILTGSDDNTAKLWSVREGEALQTFVGHESGVVSVAFSPDGQMILTGSRDGTAKLWSVRGGAARQTFQADGFRVLSVAFSPDGQTILTGGMDGTAKLWSVRGGAARQTFANNQRYVHSVAFSPDGQTILTGCNDGTAKLWSVRGGAALRTFQADGFRVLSVAFSPDGQTILTGGMDGTAKLWSVRGGAARRTFDAQAGYVQSVAFSPDGQTILTGNSDGTAELWSARGGAALQTFDGHAGLVQSVAFSPDGQTILTSNVGGNVKLWERSSGKEIATLIAVDIADWVVTNSSGLFDASPGAMRRMYYVQGLEVIALAQLKERYYEPGLLAKLAGYNTEPIRDASAVDQPLELYPEVTLSLQGDRLDVQLTTRSGGIGRVALYIDNKEVLDDIDPSRSQTIQVDLDRYERYFQVGQPALVGIQAWDRSGSLSSQVQTTSYTPQAGAKGKPAAPATQPERSGGATGAGIRFFALCIGSGDYSGGTVLDLSYAEQDARQMAQALALAGKELFLAAPPEVHLLTTCKDCPDPAAAEYPSKAKIQEALADIARQAGPQDVVVLYLSGHGITYEDYWYYLTPDMGSSVLTDKVVREQRAISSSELKEWMANIPARKQVMIIDACASGQLNQDFDLLSQKDIPSSQIRALNRLGSRAGLYVISASTADQVSYEASPYGMGLLTYGLLQGMLGAALRESEYIDVNLLFSYAEDQVPKFADYIGKAQKPMIYTPEGTASFDIGRVTAAVKQGVELAEPKPLFARARFSNPAEFGDDNLGLATQVNTLLRDYNYRGQKSPLIFVEGDELPQAYALTGSYTIADGAVRIQAVVRKDGARVGEPIILPADGDPQYTTSEEDLQRLSKQIIQVAMQRVQ